MYVNKSHLNLLKCTTYFIRPQNSLDRRFH